MTEPPEEVEIFIPNSWLPVLDLAARAAVCRSEMFELGWGGQGSNFGTLGPGNSCCVSRESSVPAGGPEGDEGFPRTLLGAAGKWVRSQPHAWV